MDLVMYEINKLCTCSNMKYFELNIIFVVVEDN